MNLVLDYSRHKVKLELSKMEKYLKILENKEYSKLREVSEPREKPRVGSI
jgi:hypothetical protein